MWDDYLNSLKHLPYSRSFLFCSDNYSATFDQFMTTAIKVGKVLQGYSQKYVLIQSGQSYRNLVGIMASVLSGKIPILDFKQSLKDDEIYLKYSLFSQKILSLFHQQAPSFDTENVNSAIDQIFADPGQTKLIFCTSGTSGDSVFINKSWFQLFQESKALKELYDLARGHSVVTLVSPFHLYGFLHGFMMPMIYGLKSYVFPVSGGLFPAELDRKITCHLLCSSPLAWEYTLRFAGKNNVNYVVSSGAALGEKRSGDCVSDKLAHIKFVELIGSTETGGIGYRFLQKDQKPDYFRIFKGVEITFHEGDAFIRSPYLGQDKSDNVTLRLSDRFASTDNPEVFQFLGRSDRVFKYAGKRYSLDETEQRLRKMLNGRKVSCQFLTDEGRLKGGTLRALIEGEPLSKAKLKQKWLEESPLPFPDMISFHRIIPRDSMGKPDFKAAFDKRPDKRY